MNGGGKPITVAPTDAMLLVVSYFRLSLTSVNALVIRRNNLFPQASTQREAKRKGRRKIALPGRLVKNCMRPGQDLVKKDFQSFTGMT
jgi:hypothetical protein